MSTLDDLHDVTAAGWDPRLHPRDRHGRFIDVGSLIRWFTGPISNQGTVDEINPDGTLRVTRSDGAKVKVRPADVTDVEMPKAHLTPTVGYHISPARNRESIQSNGLTTTSDGFDAGYAWVFGSRAEAEAMLNKPWGGSTDNDLYEVDLRGLDVVPDPHPGYSDIETWAVPGGIPADRVKLLPKAHLDVGSRSEMVDTESNIESHRIVLHELWHSGSVENLHPGGSRWGHDGVYFTNQKLDIFREEPIKVTGDFNIYAIDDNEFGSFDILRGYTNDEDYLKLATEVAHRVGLGDPPWNPPEGQYGIDYFREFDRELAQELKSRGFDGWWMGGEIVVWNYDKINAGLPPDVGSRSEVADYAPEAFGGYQFRMGSDGLAHITPPGLATALCGMNTKEAAPAKAVPHQRCLDLAAERIANEQLDVGDRSALADMVPPVQHMVGDGGWWVDPDGTMNPLAPGDLHGSNGDFDQRLTAGQVRVRRIHASFDAEWSGELTAKQRSAITDSLRQDPVQEVYFERDRPIGLASESAEEYQRRLDESPYTWEADTSGDIERQVAALRRADGLDVGSRSAVTDQVPASTPIKRSKVGNIDTDRLQRRQAWLKDWIATKASQVDNRIDYVVRAAELQAIEDELTKRGEVGERRTTPKPDVGDRSAVMTEPGPAKVDAYVEHGVNGTTFYYGDMHWLSIGLNMEDDWGGAYFEWATYDGNYDMRYASAAFMGDAPSPSLGNDLGPPEIHRSIETGKPPANDQNSHYLGVVRETVENTYLAMQGVQYGDPAEYDSYRGLANVPAGSDILQLEPGDEFVMPLSGFSPDRQFAASFALPDDSIAPPGRQVIITLKKGAKVAPSAEGYETEIQINDEWVQVPNEYITQGRFRVLKQKRSFGVYEIEIEQIATYDVDSRRFEPDVGSRSALKYKTGPTPEKEGISDWVDIPDWVIEGFAAPPLPAPSEKTIPAPPLPIGDIPETLNQLDVPPKFQVNNDGVALGKFGTAFNEAMDEIQSLHDEDPLGTEVLMNAAAMWMGREQDGMPQMSHYIRGIASSLLGHPIASSMQEELDEAPAELRNAVTMSALTLMTAAEQTPAGHALYRGIDLPQDVIDSLEVGDIIEEPLGSATRNIGIAAAVANDRKHSEDAAEVMGRDMSEDGVVMMHFPPKTKALHITPFNELEPYKWTAQEYLVSGRYRIKKITHKKVPREAFEANETQRGLSGSWVKQDEIDVIQIDVEPYEDIIDPNPTDEDLEALLDEINPIEMP